MATEYDRQLEKMDLSPASSNVQSEASVSNTVPDETPVNEREQRVSVQRKDESHLIQIKASSAEIARRISALIEQKQREVDQNNCQEFCSVHPSIEEDTDGTCARTSAVFVPRAGGKSHIKVSKVVNMYGPQTRTLGATGVTPTYNTRVKEGTSEINGLEERLVNMEEHLKIKGTGKADVYNRLKDLEERILFLEGLSPEYFTSGPPQPKRRKQDTTLSDDMSLTDIDTRMQYLRESLMRKHTGT